MRQIARPVVQLDPVEACFAGATRSLGKRPDDLCDLLPVIGTAIAPFSGFGNADADQAGPSAGGYM
jgi:hypothetical protein